MVRRGYVWKMAADSVPQCVIFLAAFCGATSSLNALSDFHITECDHMVQ